MTFLRQTQGDVRDDTSGTSKSLAAFNAVAGRLIEVTVSWESTNTTVSIADTAGNTYVPLTKKKSAANNQWVQKFYCLSATGNAANVVTATWASAADFRGIDCASYSYSGTASFDNEGNGDQAAGTTLTMTLTPTGTGSNLLTTGIKSFNSNTFQNGYAAG